MIKSKPISKVLAVVLCAMMLMSVIPMSVFAEIENYNKDYQSATHTVFKHTEQTLAPGVTQYTNYAYTTADGKQMVYYVTTADVNRDDVIMQVSYKGMQHDTLGMEKLAETVKVANAKYSDPSNPEFISEYYTVVSATNGNGYNMTTGMPSGVWAMGGDIITDYAGGSCYLAIDGNGKAVMGKTVAEWNALKAGAGVKEAINCFGSILLWDGEIQITQSSSYYSDRASRTMVGITEDGKIVCAVVDGRQEPFSCGASMLELAHIMLEAGCTYAMNLDGGGSTTFMAKNEGSNECTVNNRPSDGSERAISNGIIIASLAAPSNVFDHASITVSNDHVMPNASVDISAKGVSPAGTSAEIPEDVSYETELGKVENGIYTAGNTTGIDTIKMMHNGQVVGSCQVNIVAPTKISFAAASVACPYGKTATLNVIPTYGEFDLEVAYSSASITFTLGDNDFGTVENGQFTATTSPLDNTTSTITVTTNCTPSVSATVALQVGRGSEIIWDFEDQDVSKWSYFDYYNSKTSLDIYTVDSTTGKVHDGNYALALHYDYSQTTYYEDYLSLIVEYNAETIKAHGASNKDSQGGTIGGLEEDYIDITGACGMGFWLYLPDEMDICGFNPRLMFGFKKNPTDTWSRGTTSMKLIVDVQHLPTDGWYYYWADLSSYSTYSGLKVQNARPLSSNGSSKNGYGGYAAGNYYAGSILDFYVEESAWKAYNNKSYNGNFTLYIDNWTVDYSTVVEDNQAPEFGNANYACNGMFDAASFIDGTVIKANEIDFTIDVADATRFLPAGSTEYKNTNNAVGINASTARAYIDGIEVACTYKNGKLAIDKSLVLADGVHRVTFAIADNNGNLAKKTFIFTVDADTGYDTIKVVPHDETLTETLAGSLYYIDLVATNIANINKVSTTLKVNNVNNWEPIGMVVADGFSAMWTTEPGDDGEIYLTITRTGDVTATGELVLASIPIRAWYPHNALGKDSAWLIANNRIFPMDIKLTVKAGVIEFIDEPEYLGAFSALDIQIDNESMCEAGYIGVIQGKENNGENYKTSLHTHTTTALSDKAATCTEAGYTGRTYCEVCNSVVDWGTTIPATDHTYEVTDGILKCTTCDELFSGVWTDGKTYVDGVVVANGWMGESYYRDGVKLTGLQEIDGYYYDFGDEGVCAGKAKLSGFYYDEAAGKYMYFAAGLKITGEVNAFPTAYFFGEDGYAISGDVEIWGYTCTFSEKGEFISSADASVVDAGFCGTNLNYVLLSDGTLKVGGEGVMKDYTANGNYPMWIIKNEPTAVTSLVIGNGITHIGRFGFYRNQYLKSVSFEEGSNLKSIGWGAFGHCWRLVGVTLPASLEVLEEYAFYECGELKYVNVEAGSKLHTIKHTAFRHAIKLETVFIPDSVVNLSANIFYKANPDLVLNVVAGSIAEEYAKNNNIKYETREGIVPLVDSGVCNEITWEFYSNGKLKIVGNGAMTNFSSYRDTPWFKYANNIKTITIGKDVTAIGNNAFAYYYQNVTEIVFEEGSALTRIGVLSFMNVPKVESIVLPDSVTYIGSHAFSDCFALKNIHIPQGVTFIHALAFRKCSNVVLNVAEGTYAENYAITNGLNYTIRDFVYIPIASGTCGENVFWNIYENNELVISGSGAMINYASHTEQPWRAYANRITKITIGKDITSIGNYAFAYSFQNVTEIVFEEGSTLTRVGVLSFMNVPKVESIVLPDSMTYIGSHAFSDCFALKNIHIPQGVTFIHALAFRKCSNVVLNVAEGTYAEGYARENDLSYTVR